MPKEALQQHQLLPRGIKARSEDCQAAAQLARSVRQGGAALREWYNGSMALRADVHKRNGTPFWRKSFNRDEQPLALALKPRATCPCLASGLRTALWSWLLAVPKPAPAPWPCLQQLLAQPPQLCAGFKQRQPERLQRAFEEEPEPLHLLLQGLRKGAAGAASRAACGQPGCTLWAHSTHCRCRLQVPQQQNAPNMLAAARSLCM